MREQLKNRVKFLKLREKPVRNQILAVHSEKSPSEIEAPLSPAIEAYVNRALKKQKPGLRFEEIR